MKSLRKNWWKVIIIVFIFAAVDLILHGLVSLINASSTPHLKPSIFVKKGLLIPAVSIYSFIDFGILAVSFIFIQDSLLNKKWINGVLFGFSLGMIYFIGMFEGVLILNDTISNSLLMGLIDFIPILLMCTALGIVTGVDKVNNMKKQNVLFIFFITIVFVIGRYFSYSVLHINSAYTSKPLGTLVWTLCQGLSLGIFYFNMQLDYKVKSLKYKEVFITVAIFSLNWLIYHLFVAIIFEVSFVDIFIRVGIDSIFSMFGIYLWQRLYIRFNTNTPNIEYKNF